MSATFDGELVASSGPTNYFTIDCDATEVMSGGYASDAAVLNFVLSNPTTRTTWRMGFVNVDNKTATTTLYAICIR